MTTGSTTQTWNKLKIIKVELLDLYDGAVTFESLEGRQFSAFFWGQEFKINTSYLVRFDWLGQLLEWETIFSENKDHLKIVQTNTGYCSCIAYGQILSINPVVVDFGDFVMELGDWTHDDRVVGEFIYWAMDRLDVLEVNDSENPGNK